MKRPIAGNTFAGMASWSGSGPDGAICRECEWFQYDKTRPGKEQRCSMFKRLSGGKEGEKFPPTAPACRHFQKRGQHHGQDDASSA